MATVVLKVLSSLFISVLLHHYFSDYVAFFADKYMLTLKTPITHTHDFIPGISKAQLLTLHL